MKLYESIVITGGGGMLARDLDRVLRARGVEPVLARHAECDISDPAQLARYFKAHRPTLVLNCAADTAVDLCEERPERANAINGQGAGNLAELCKEYSARLVHYSTDFVFSGQNGRPYRPDDIPDPLSAYGKSKLLGEENVKVIDPPGWLTVRTAWLFGRYGNCFPRVIVDRARAGHVLKVVDDQIGCPTYSVDLAAATLELLDRGAKGIWHVTNSFPTSWFEFAKAVLTEFAISAEVTPISTSEWVAMRPKQARRPKFSVLDLDPYAALTGKKLRGWRDALRDYRTECEKG
ncbi:MAG: dTDP-4-dehydrorhamnose reductase [Phycisphaerales bacterium]|nr:dTDP-4-dehydrorhamnose reductase [Phycisphaerales bacterium]